MTVKNEIKLSAPWEIFYRQMEAMFWKDPQITLDIDHDKRVVKLLVDNPTKANALGKILPATKEFGNISVSIIVVPADKQHFYDSTVFDDAFDGNPAYAYAETVKMDGTNNPMTFVVFAKEVVQYYGDNPFAEHGQISTLYEDIAEEVFDTNGVYYSTTVEDK